MSSIIYSVNIGGYDNLISPKIYDKNIRYILFTDNKYFKSNVWEICHIDFLNNLDNRLKSRYIKLNPGKVLPPHDNSLWVDNNIIPNISNFNDFLVNIKFLGNNIMLFKHRIRSCIYEESKKVLDLKKEIPNVVKKQMEKYISEGYPKNYGLFETGFMIRNNNKETNEFNEFWWNEVLNGSGRDQLSQMYSSWKTSTKITPINIGNDNVLKNRFSTYTPHIIELTY